jgi:hypothetical protein
MSQRHRPVVAASATFHRQITAASLGRGGINKSIHPRRHVAASPCRGYFHKSLSPFAAASSSRGGISKTTHSSPFLSGIALSWRLPPIPTAKARRHRPVVAASTRIYTFVAMSQRHRPVMAASTTVYRQVTASPCRGGFPFSHRHRPVVAASPYFPRQFAAASPGRGGITKDIHLRRRVAASPCRGYFHKSLSPFCGGIIQSWRHQQNYKFVAISQRHRPVVAASSNSHRHVTAASSCHDGIVYS